MKPLTYILFSLCLLILGCSSPQPRSHFNSEITFTDYLKSLDTIGFPFKTSCSNDRFSGLATKFDSTAFNKYKLSDSVEPFGVLFNDSTSIVTIEIVNADYCRAPILASYDKIGHKLDSLNVYGHSYIDTASSDMPFVKISRDKKIVIIDTTKNWAIDSSNNVVSGSQKIKIDSTIYSISRKGKFIKETGRKL